jgi:hypothetical protein
MTKYQQSNREVKKQASLSLKEKRAAKRLKKHAGDAVSLIANIS